MSELIGRTGQPMLGRNLCLLCRLVAKRLQEEGSHEPYESRGSRTDLWGAGGEIPPVCPAFKWWTHKSESTDAEHRGGPPRSSDEGR
jgi:hypothetical protein